VTPSSDHIDHVLVPVDGSPFADRALRPAQLLADRLHASLSVVTVISASGHASSQGSTVAAEVLIGDDAGETIGEYADHLSSSLVCMSTHGRGWPSSVFVGSAAAVVLSRTEAPIILVGPSYHAGWQAEGTILVAVDGNPGSEMILPDARAWASMLAMSLTVATVAEPAPAPLRPEHAHRLHGPQGDVDSYIAKLVAPLQGTDVEVNGQIIWDPIGPATGFRGVLVDGTRAVDGPVGLLAISAHSHKPPPGVALGQTALRIVHQSPVPVLVFPFLDQTVPTSNRRTR
jgi:nucleotide-binding universal stress UspA family protein